MDYDLLRMEVGKDRPWVDFWGQGPREKGDGK